MKLEPGQIAVVTGAASGIGRALCDAFGNLGMHVVMADVEPEALRQASGELIARGVVIEAVVTDVGDHDAVEALAARTFDRFGHVDVVCSNAGVFGGVAPAWEFDHLDWTWMLQVNLWGAIHAVEAFLGPMVERDQGHLVFTASMAGLGPIPFTSPYNVAKYGLVGLVETLDKELTARHSAVSVTALCPGGVNTQIGLSSRNRPEPLTPSARRYPSPVLGETDEEVDQIMSMTVLPVSAPNRDSNEVAEMVIRAIERGELYVLTGADAVGLARSRIDQLTAHLACDPGAAPR